MTIQKPDQLAKRDVLGCSTDLIQALTQPELSEIKSEQPVSPGSQRASLWLAVALGRCRLFGADPGDHNGVLPAWIAIAAANELSIQLRRLTDKIREWAEQVEQQESDVMDDGLDVGHIFFLWMDIWAAFEAIDEGYDACVTAEDEAEKEFRHILDSLNRESESLNEEAQNHTDLLCVVAETELLSNWRSFLVEPYKGLVPWWLDGTLETANKCRSLRQTARQ